MKKEIVLICATALVIVGLYAISNRYVFLIKNERIIAVGDKWIGCVDYSRLSTKDDLLDKDSFGGVRIEVPYGEMIRSEC